MVGPDDGAEGKPPWSAAALLAARAAALPAAARAVCMAARRETWLSAGDAVSGVMVDFSMSKRRPGEASSGKSFAVHGRQPRGNVRSKFKILLQLAGVEDGHDIGG